MGRYLVLMTGAGAEGGHKSVAQCVHEYHEITTTVQMAATLNPCPSTIIYRGSNALTFPVPPSPTRTSLKVGVSAMIKIG